MCCKNPSLFHTNAKKNKQKKTRVCWIVSLLLHFGAPFQAGHLVLISSPVQVLHKSSGGGRGKGSDKRKGILRYVRMNQEIH